MEIKLNKTDIECFIRNHRDDVIERVFDILLENSIITDDDYSKWINECDRQIEGKEEMSLFGINSITD